MNALARFFTAAVAAFRTVGDMPAPQLLLRAALLATGTGAVFVPHQPWIGGMAVLLGVGILGALMAAIAPDSPGATITLVAVAVVWVIAYGLHGVPPIALTMALAADLYLFHTLAALCAAMPPTARIDAGLLVGWGRQALVTLVVSGVVAAGAFGLPRLRGSLPLELVGLLGVIALTAVPVWLARARR